ncbi:MAG: efflux RND transporter periplasmic adaptor subunit [Nevskiaceae bacterium]|nr:MAG: efflux RND transporter periplasmic adaptor subunit [Nevskiaceae bacterium]
MNAKNLLRFLPTLALFIVAIVVAVLVWRHYMDSPWTRDGRVKASVINVAPDVSGLVTEVAVHDNQFVHRGDVLFRIDAMRYRLALTQAEAALAAQQTQVSLRRREAQRRAHLAAEVVTVESRDSAVTQADAAVSQYDAAVAARDVARLNLDRTEVRAPADGWITNLDVHAGDYAGAGRALLAVIDSHSFWVYGYFEETKLPLLKEGDPAEIRLISGPVLQGHVESITRGITDRDNTPGQQLLANVNPTFSWVRLAQRIPVRIHIDAIPADVTLAAGMTCTVIVKPAAR